MYKDVHLFIGRKEVEFSTPPYILYTYDMDNASNPTIVKNEYSKTITIDGTDNNNQIFNNLWDLSQYQPNGVDTTYASYFNPSKRVDYELYVDGDIVESGYVKLDTITRDGNHLQYNITLFGGIGDFFYSLSYNSDGDELKLKDLTYTTATTPSAEFDFDITKDNVDAAWKRLQYGTGDTKWDHINFAPCYNGYPDSIDTDKVLINTNEYYGTTRIHSGDTLTTTTGFPTSISGGYSLYNGYALSELNGKMTEWDMRDLRSYLQRPVLRVKSLINACCDSTQNGGYTVELDSTFFNTGNTYYENAWMTLPMLNDMEYTETDQTWNLHIDSTIYQNNKYDTRYGFAEDSPRGHSTEYLSITFRPQLTVLTYSGVSSSITYDTLYTSARISSSGNIRTDYGSMVYQFVGYDAQGNVVAGSDIYNLTSSVNGNYLNLGNTAYAPLWSNSSVQNRIGNWTKVSGNTFQWGEDITLKMDTSSVKVATVRLRCYMAANLETVSSYNGSTAQTYGARQAKLYGTTAVTNFDTQAHTSTFVKPTVSGVATYDADSTINSGAKVTKQMLLSLDGTPASYFINYCKCFGLIFEKDIARKKIYVRARNTYYSQYASIENWDERLDKSKEMTITPLTFDTKWYKFNYDDSGDRCKFGEKYNYRYGDEYGQQKVNTGYNFDSETKDLLDGTPYKPTVEGVEKSAYFYQLKYNSEYIANFLYSWSTYSLFNSDYDSASVEVAAPVGGTKYYYVGFGDLYDCYPKADFRDSDNKPLEGAGCFLFYNGMHSTKVLEDGTEMSLVYYLTDDVLEMSLLNNNTCWLYTCCETDVNDKTIAISRTRLPMFGRYVRSDNYIKNSWDFGKVKELYIPSLKYLENASIYDRYWSNYIGDVYDVNSRKLECYLHLPNIKPTEMLKKFIWIDNAVWVINKISDYNICSNDSTKVELLKVQDVTNYSTSVSPVVPTSETFTITLTTSPATLPASGGTFNAMFTSDRQWYCLADTLYYSGVEVGYITNLGTGHSSGTTGLLGYIGANSQSTSRTITIYVRDGNDTSVRLYITQSGTS